MLDAPGSQIVDRALAALIEQLEGAHERRILSSMPYEDDPDLGWAAPAGPGLAYDADVPADVLRLAKQRRARRNE